MSLWPAIIAAGAVTFTIRLSFILLIGVRQPPELVQRALRYVPPAVLSAIVFQELFVGKNGLSFSPANPRLLAGLVAILVAWRTRNAILTIILGMLALWLIQGLLGG